MLINEANAKPRCMQWDEQAFVTDNDVQRMSSVERWCYRTLLNKAYWCATRPYLPDDDNELWFLAGCKDREQWDSVKKNVRKMFQKQKIHGKKVLARKRLVDDWKIFLSKLQKLQENGRLGGVAKAKLMLNACQKEEVEVEVEYKKEVEVEFKEADMSGFTEKIAQLALEHLHVIIPPSDKNYSELRKRASIVGGQDKVVSAFETFCQDHEGDRMPYPLGAFLREFDGNPTLSEKPADNDQLPELINQLVQIANDEGIIFESKHRAQIRRLLVDYSPLEIKSAWRAFYDTLADDFDRKHAARKFSDGAEQILALQRSRQKKAQETEEMVRDVTARERARAEAELLEKLAADAAEADLIEDTLPE